MVVHSPRSRLGLEAATSRISLPARARACMFLSSPSLRAIVSSLPREYDFFTFNTIAGGGNVSVTTYVAPTLNALGPDRPVALAVSVNSLSPQTTYFIPPATPGNLPAQWDGLDGFVVRTIMACRRPPHSPVLLRRTASFRYKTPSTSHLELIP